MIFFFTSFGPSHPPIWVILAVILAQLDRTLPSGLQQVARGRQEESVGPPDHRNIVITFPNDFPDDLGGIGGA